MRIAIIAITAAGARLGSTLRERLADAELFVPEQHSDLVPAAHPFAAPLKEWVAELWEACDGFVCIMAAGIVVRIVAPLLRGKEKDPAVVVMDEAGRFAVSLLSGHLGGGNELATKVAAASGGQAVITTATDVNGLFAWDEAARRASLVPEPVAHIKRLNTLLLTNGRIALVDRVGRIAPWFIRTPGVVMASNFAEAFGFGAGGQVLVTHRYIPQLEQKPSLLLLRPRDLVVGIGCNRGTPAVVIESAILATLQAAFLSPLSIACLTTIDAKEDEAGLLEFAAQRELPVEFHSADALNRVALAAPPSPHALAAVGAQGVCEPAALLSAGATALLVKKRKHGNVTVAVAEKK